MATPSLTKSDLVATPGILVSSQAANGEATIYTAPANKAVLIKTAAITNTSGAAKVVSVSVVPSGGAADGTHRVLSTYSLAAGDTLPLGMLAGVFLGAGDFISINASAAASIDVVLTGIVFA